MEKTKDEKRTKKIIFSLIVILLLVIYFITSEKFFLVQYNGYAMYPSMEQGRKYWFIKKDIHQIKRGDIITFIYDDSSLCISRVIGISGDTIEFYKNKLLKPPLSIDLTIMNDYYIYVPKNSRIESLISAKNIIHYEIIPDSFYVISTDSLTINYLSTCIKEMKYEVKEQNEDEPDHDLWKILREKSFNMENFTYVVPVDSLNVKKYFFLLNDNRTNAIDSRHFGPIEGCKVTGVYAGF
jgi:signal peptidase I